MITASQFADSIGRKQMALALGLGLTAISNAVVRGKFPSSWLATCRDLAIERDVDFPVALFSQRGFHGDKRGNAPAACQATVAGKAASGGAS